MMNTPFVTFDSTANAIYIRFSDRETSRSLELSETVYMDLDENGAPVGMEILHVEGPLPDAMKHVSGGASLSQLLALVS